MIADLKPYPEYKESGLPWLGRLPRHWKVRRMKSAVENAIEQTDEMRSDDVYVALEHVEGWTGKTRPQRGAHLFSGQVKRFRGNDVLFGKLRPYLAKAARLPVEGVCAGEFFVLRVRDSSLLPPYLELQIRAKQTIDVINSSTFGAKMPRADWQFVGNLPICLPPPEEQAAMVRFLDYANGRLERAIRAKRRVIALLHEQKQAIIHRAVTRGLDPTVPLKPSGIPWLGDIPKHWEVLRAKYLFGEVDERSASGQEELLSVSHITGVTPRSQKNITMFKAQSYVGHKLCSPGDLVVNTMWAWMAALGVSARTGIISPAYAVYRPRNAQRIVGGFIDGLLRTRPYVSNIICRSTGVRASRLRLYPEEFFRLLIILPPAREQQQIVDSVAAETVQLTTAVASLDREISLLREYRTRLVADVVTGKLDVRPAARHLPAEPLAPEPAPESETLGDSDDIAEAEVGT
jgi:type I restriction enzyme S subunit